MNETKPPTADIDAVEIMRRIDMDISCLSYEKVGYTSPKHFIEVKRLIEHLTQQNQQALASNRAKDERIEKLEAAIKMVGQCWSCGGEAAQRIKKVDCTLCAGTGLLPEAVKILAADDAAQRKGAK